MSIVRYTNKKTGVVSLYESTSHYDPVTKQSRPIRKYLGVEDPVTKELIPSAGKRGRKKGSKNKQEQGDSEYRLLYEDLKKECLEKDRLIKQLSRENQVLSSCLLRIREMTNGIRLHQEQDTENTSEDNDA